MDDSSYMALAVELAERGVGWVSPNPLVGAVLVKDGCVIGRGWHERCGGLHAERAALADCREDPAGAVLYVTLEPCCHTGRQPPCTEAILAAGIRRVVVGSMDPNPLVAGKGVELLRTHGVEVETGVLREQCDALNPVFFHYIRTKRPYVVMKYAMTLDGKIAAYTGASRWITREAARRHVHEMRHRYRGILAGVGTVLSDDPLLTCRIPGGRDPVRIICDTSLRTPPGRGEHVDLPALMDALGAAEIDGVLLEGGGTLNWAMLEAGLVQRVQAYIAPKLLGGAGARSPVEGRGVEAPDQAAHLRKVTVTALGEDFLLEGEVDRDVYGTH